GRGPRRGPGLARGRQPAPRGDDTRLGGARAQERRGHRRGPRVHRRIPRGVSPAPRARTCPRTGLHLVPARGQDGWRVAQERYTRSGGILAVRVNEHVGPLPADLPDRRGRFDTIGRTVYFAERATTAFEIGRASCRERV